MAEDSETAREGNHRFFLNETKTRQKRKEPTGVGPPNSSRVQSSGFSRDTEEVVKVAGVNTEKTVVCPCCTSRKREPMCLSRSCASSPSMCPCRAVGRLLSVKGGMAEIV